MHTPILTPAARSAVDILRDDFRRADWPRAEAELRRAGPAVWPQLAEIVATGPVGGAARAGALLGFDTVTDATRREVSDLRSTDPNRRSAAAFGLGTQRNPAAYARVLAALLNDPDPAVVSETVRAFGILGRAAVPVLHEVRATPGRARRAALSALAEIGWDTIDPAGIRALARLIARKQASEVLEPFSVFEAEWFALPTHDQAAVLGAFDLSDPVPVTVRAGLERWTIHHDYPSQVDNRDDDHRRCGQMFVSPVLDGWTLVFGTPGTETSFHLNDVAEDQRHTAWQQRCQELSRQFGSAYWFADTGSHGWEGWCLAEYGEVVRYWCSWGDFVEVGDPLPAETELNPPGQGLWALLRDEVRGEGVLGAQAVELTRLMFDQLCFDDTEFGASAAAYQGKADAWLEEVKAVLARAGVEYRPAADAGLIADRATVRLGPDTSVHGHGVLALTACGRQYGHGHRGAFAL